MKSRLTDALIQKHMIKNGERIEIFDAQVPGFGVRIGSRERAFFFIRRVNGRKVRMSLGVYPVVSLAKARSLALSILDRIKAGEDPTHEFKRRKPQQEPAEDIRFGRVVERFLTQYCRGKKTPLRARTTAEYERHLLKGAAAAWKDRPISSIIEKDIIAVVDRLEQQGHFATARLFKAYMRKFLGWCVERHLIARNPAVAVPLSSNPSDFVRERTLSIWEIRRVLNAADQLAPPYRAFVYILALCGQRRFETSVMRWADLELEGEKPIWRIPAEVTKNRRAHDVPLPPLVAEILRQVPQFVSEEVGGEGQLLGTSCYVFSGDGKAAVSGFSKIKAKIDKLIEAERQASGGQPPPLAHWTWHDLRRSAATAMADIGVAPHVIEAILNHVSGTKAGVAGVYNRSSYDQERRKALTMWSELLLLPQSPEVDEVRVHRAEEQT